MISVPTVLRVPAFRSVWLASLASNAGSWLQVVAAGWLILELTGSPAAVGALALVTRGPALLLSPYAGGLADRFDRRMVGIVTFALQSVAAAAMAVVAWADLATPAVIYLLTFALGVGFALGLPAMLALIPALVSKDRLSQAVSLNAAGINVARLAGPAIGGITLATLGAGACFALNAVSFMALVLALLRLEPSRAAHTTTRARSADAWRHAFRDPAPRRLLIGMAVFCALASPVQELAPVVAEGVGAEEVGLGLLLGAMGGGALLGAWALEHLVHAGFPRYRALPTATVAFGVATAGLAAAPNLPLAIVAMACGGVFWIWMFAATNTAIQLGSPPALLGRMLGLYQLSVIGPIAIGSLAVGGIAEVVGIGWSLAGCAVALVAYGAWGLANPVTSIDRKPRAAGEARPAPTPGVTPEPRS